MGKTAEQTKGARPKLKPGRKPGQVGVSQRARARALAQAEVKPLEVLLETMAGLWNRSKEAAKPAQVDKLRKEACAVARDVAPYLHPKLNATTLKGDQENPVAFVLSLPDCEELRKAIRGDDKA